MRNAIIALAIGLILGAGAAWLAMRHKHDDDHGRPPEGAEEKASQRTVWTDRFEVFLEHPPLAAGEPADFVTHVTDLVSLEPRKAGAIAYLLKRGADAPVEVRAMEPIRPGIYKPALTFPLAGDWNLSIRIDDIDIELGAFVVHPTRAAAHEAPAPGEIEGVAFLKEQQWKLGTKAEAIGRRKLVQRLRVPGVVAARPGSRAALAPIVEGRLMPPTGGSLPRVGERVEADQLLARVQPPFSDFAAKLIESEADIIRTRVALEQAEAAVARLRKLVAEGARTPRELADAEFTQRTAQANHEAAKALRAAYAKSGAVLADDGRPVFELRSPIAGLVIRVSAGAGEHVHTETPVFTILDSSRVWIEARVSEADLNRLGGLRAALFETPDAPGRLAPAGGAPVHTAAEVDPATRTVALVYEAENASGALRIGMALTLHVETARSEEDVAVPESAVVDEEGRFVAFVQVSGETFEKRDLRLGIREAGHAQVLSGLKEGERVVTRGAYAVRLASVSTSIPAHGHSH